MRNSRAECAAKATISYYKDDNPAHAFRHEPNTGWGCALYSVWNRSTTEAFDGDFTLWFYMLPPETLEGQLFVYSSIFQLFVYKKF